MKLGWRIGIIVLLQSAALIAMMAIKQYTLSTGIPVIIKTKPIDPRSLFRGDYVLLNYSISQLVPMKLGGDKHFARSDTIYVVLQQVGTYWQAQSIYHHMPKADKGQVVIKGRVQYAYTRAAGRSGRNSRPQLQSVLDVKYGVENYFVPERQGLALERAGQGETISIRLVVDRFGNAAIKAVLVNGIVRYQEKVF